MADYGIKISKPQIDANRTDVANLVLSSEYSVPKMVKFGAGIITVSGGSGSTTIAHGQPNASIALVYIENVAGDGKRYLLNTGQLVNFYFTVDVTNLVITANGAANATYSFYYYIFADLL